MSSSSAGGSNGLGPHGAGRSLILGISPLERPSCTARSGSLFSAMAAALLMATPAHSLHFNKKITESDWTVSTSSSSSSRSSSI